MANSNLQNVQSGSVLAQLDLAITLSETALSAPDRNSARRSMVLARQVLDGVERSVLNCKGGAEIDIRLDRMQLLLRQYNDSYGQRENKRIDVYPPRNHYPEANVETLPTDEIHTARELLTARVRCDTPEALNCRPDPRKQARSAQASWPSLFLGILNKSSAWLKGSIPQSGSPRTARLFTSESFSFGRQHLHIARRSVRDFLDRLQHTYRDTSQKLRMLTQTYMQRLFH